LWRWSSREHVFPAPQDKEHLGLKMDKNPEGPRQDKAKETAFFDQHAEADEYDVFTAASNHKITDLVATLSNVGRGDLVLDIGCGSGVFTDILGAKGCESVGLDLSRRLIEVGRRRFPSVRFVVGDGEQLPFPSESLDGALLSGVVHHLPDPRQCAQEVFRVLKPGRSFVAFDPNRRNPFMWLYRDKSSPFYSSVGVTENERPVLAEEAAAAFRDAGFQVASQYLSGLSYRYVASSTARWVLPAYNFIDDIMFRPRFMKLCRAFVFTYGVKS